MWVHLPTSVYSPESVPSDSDLKSLCQMLSVSVMWRSKPQPSKFWQRVLRTGALRTVPFGAISQPLMVACGVERWIFSQAVFRAKTSLLPESGPDSQGSAQASGGSSSGSSKKSSRQTSSSKTSGAYSQVGLFSTDPTYWDTSTAFSVPRLLRGSVGPLKLTSIDYSGEFSRFTASQHCTMSRRAWELWVTKARQDFSRRQKLARVINVSGSSSSPDVWPTARAEDSESCGNHPGATDSLTGVTRDWLTPHGMNGTDHTGKQGRGGEFAKQATEWQTPATDSFRSRGGDRKDEMGLDQQTRFWPTPNAAAHSANTNREERGAGGPNLHETSQQWPTPTAWEQSENPESFEARRQREQAKGRNGNGMGAPLDMVASSWPTPNVPNGGRTSNTTDTREDGSKRQVDLGALVTTWGTPTSRDWKDGASPDQREGRGDNGLVSLQVLSWPTPTAKIADGSQTHHGSANGRQNELLLDGLAQAFDTTFLSSLRDPEHLSNGGESSPITRTSLPPSQRKKLNASFVEILQGLPLGWTSRTARIDSAALETWLSRCRSHLQSLLSREN